METTRDVLLACVQAIEAVIQAGDRSVLLCANLSETSDVALELVRLTEPTTVNPQVLEPAMQSLEHPSIPVTSRKNLELQFAALLCLQAAQMCVYL